MAGSQVPARPAIKRTAVTGVIHRPIDCSRRAEPRVCCLSAGGASQQRTRLWNQAIGQILFELFFYPHPRARGQKRENPPRLAVCRRGVRNGIP